MDARTFTLRTGEKVTLSENEQIILERMRDDDGTEYVMLFSPTAVIPTASKFVPRDQVAGLELNALVKYIYSTEDPRGSAVAAGLTSEGCEVLAQMRRSSGAGRYAELSLEDMIEIAAQKADMLVGAADEILSEDLAYLVQAIKARHDETGAARARIGEYLRQTLLAHERKQESRKWVSPRDRDEDQLINNVLTEVTADKYAKRAQLLFGDLAQLAPVAVRDTEAEFMAQQQRRLAYVLEHNKLSDKQREVLEEVAKGNVSWSSYGGLRWREKRLDGRTFESLKKRGLLDTVSASRFSSDSHFCIKRPQDEGYRG
jgi:hypothetical protein